MSDVTHFRENWIQLKGDHLFFSCAGYIYQILLNPFERFHSVFSNFHSRSIFSLQAKRIVRFALEIWVDDFGFTEN